MLRAKKSKSVRKEDYGEHGGKLNWFSLHFRVNFCLKRLEFRKCSGFCLALDAISSHGWLDMAPSEMLKPLTGIADRKFLLNRLRFILHVKTVPWLR